MQDISKSVDCILWYVISSNSMFLYNMEKNVTRATATQRFRMDRRVYGKLNVYFWRRVWAKNGKYVIQGVPGQVGKLQVVI